MLLQCIVLGLLPLCASPHIWAQDWARDMDKKFNALADAAPALARGHFGFKVVNLQTGALLAQKNASSFFTPASNTKLYTTALALTRLGPDYKFQTELRTSANWMPGQQTVPDLQFIGGGDPNLSGRMLPYAVDLPEVPGLPALAEFASDLAAAGIREIDGDVTGVATRYAGDPYPDGWTIDDSLYSYGAPVSALAINDNTISLLLHATESGELARVELRPACSHFTVLDQVITDESDSAHIQISRPPGSSEVVVWGTIGKKAPAWREDLGVDDPALFAAEALVDSLRDHGITVRGIPRAEYCQPNEVAAASNNCPSPFGTVLATHQSAPLWEAVQVINKVSQNLHAEMLLREVAHVQRGTATLAAALATRDDFLKEIGITPEASGYSFGDGSGLARQDLATPDATVALLQYMWRGPTREVWMRSLPIGGVDGSLQHRFKNMVAADHVHAKTGSISHVDTLSGYVETQQHGWLAFSIMANATVGPESQTLDLLDAFCGLFLAE